MRTTSARMVTEARVKVTDWLFHAVMEEPTTDELKVGIESSVCGTGCTISPFYVDFGVEILLVKIGSLI